MSILDRIQQSKKIKQEKPVNAIDIFNELTHKSGHAYLRSIQSSFLEKWEERRNEKDLVGIMPTGAGKTLVGLLILLAKMNEGIGPSLYLCPNKQLANQVLEQARLNGIPAVTFGDVSSNIPSEFSNSEAILITTFDKVFNGKSVFGVSGLSTIETVGSVVIDDAHSSIKRARQQSTFIIKKSDAPEDYQEILSMVSNELESQGYGHFKKIKEGDAQISKLVPYWYWKENYKKIREIIDNLYEKNKGQILFPYDLIIDNLEYSQMFISGRTIEITPMKLPIEKIVTLNDAKHRLFLSASFGNNHELISELGVEKHSVTKPIEISSFSNVGEKMILTPSHYHKNITDDIVRLIVKNQSEVRNVVVIVPSKHRAKPWENVGGVVVSSNQEVINAIKTLKESTGNLIVFVNRYDGIDLPSESCNFLIIDGLPTGASLRDKYNYDTRPQSLSNISHRAQEVEQGLGRTVRSSNDYSVVFMMGYDLLNFIARKNNRTYFTKYTQGQLDLSLELSKDTNFNDIDSAIKEIITSVNLCLDRNEDWIQLYKNHIQEYIADVKSNKDLYEIAEVEAEVKLKYSRGDFHGAVKTMELLTNQTKIDLSDEDIGYYLQHSAEIMYEYDNIQADNLQNNSNQLNPTLLKPKNKQKVKRNKIDTPKNYAASKFMRTYNSNIELADSIQKISESLIYDPKTDNKEFEQAVKQLGLFLGFESTRPEQERGDKGPDNLWRSSGKDYVIECKNQSINGVVSKSELGQIAQARAWYKENYSNEYSLILFHPDNTLHQLASLENGVRVVTSAKLELLKNNLETFQQRIRNMNINKIDEFFIEDLYGKYDFGVNSFIHTYTLKLKR